MTRHFLEVRHQEHLRKLGVKDIGDHVDMHDAEYEEHYALWRATLPKASPQVIHLKALGHAGWVRHSAAAPEVKKEKRSHELRWIIALLAAIFLLLAFQPKAHAQFSHINNIDFRNNDNSAATFVASPFTFKAGANCTWSVSGTTITFNCSGGAAAAGGSNTQVQYNATGSLGGISTFTSDGTINTAKVGADWLFVDPTSATKKFSFDASNITAGQTRTINVPDANSTTVQTLAAIAHNFATAMSAQGVFTLAQPACADISDAGVFCNGTAYSSLTGVPSTFAPSAHNILSASHGDTTAAAAVRGDGFFAIGATPTWQRLAHPATSGGYFKWNGTDIVASTLAASGTGTPTACTNQAVTGFTLNADAAPTSTCATITSAFTSGTFSPSAHNLLSATHGDTTSASVVLGDIITGQTGPVWAKLAGNTTSTKQYLSQTGTGSVSAAPAWAQVAYADLSGTPQLPVTKASIASNWLNSYTSSTGVFTATQPAFTDISGSVAAGQMPALTGAITTSAGAVATSPGKDDLLDSQNFCAAAGASATTYTCSLSPAITAYVTGTHYRFKADVANSGAATINLNALGAIAIKKAAGGVTTALVANDLQAGQWVDLVYDGTNMQMQSLLGNAPGAGGGCTFTTSGQGDLWLPTIGHPYSSGNSAAVASANRVMVIAMSLPCTYKATAFLYNISTTVASSHCDIGWYDSGGNLLVHTGSIDSSTNAKHQNATAATSISGFGYYAWSCDATTVQFTGILDTTQSTIFNGDATVRYGRCANAATAGVLPATCGALTADASVNPPMTIAVP